MWTEAWFFKPFIFPLVQHERRGKRILCEVCATAKYAHSPRQSTLSPVHIADFLQLPQSRHYFLSQTSTPLQNLRIQ